jgi:outer membrane protein OmpA-like peptidoglycan-associated protein
MKILIFGFLVLSGWSAISTHIWVCKVLGLCDEQITVSSDNTVFKNAIETDSLNKLPAQAKPLSPGDLQVYFEFDRSEFKSDSMTDRYYAASKSYMEDNIQAQLNITGYTDSVGSDEYNQDLGYRRAQTMQYYFNNKGLKADRILIESKGEKDPASENKTVSGRANNRRAIITIKN